MINRWQWEVICCYLLETHTIWHDSLAINVRLPRQLHTIVFRPKTSVFVSISWYGWHGVAVFTKGGFTPELVWFVSQWICAFSRDLQTVVIRVEKKINNIQCERIIFGIMGLQGMNYVRNMLLYGINSAWVRLQFSEDTIIYGILRHISFSGKFHSTNHGPSSVVFEQPQL